MHLSANNNNLLVPQLLSTHNNNNSPHKLEIKFYMWVDDQKLRFNLEWPI